jgi:hypothetical protein
MPYQVLIAEAQDVANSSLYKSGGIGMKKGGLEDRLNPRIFSPQHRLSDAEEGLGEIQGPCRPLDGDLIAEQFYLLLPPPK